MNIHDYIHFMHDGTWVVNYRIHKRYELVTLFKSTHRTGWSAVIELTSYCLQNNIKMADYNELEWRRYYSECDRHIEHMLADKDKMSNWEMAFSCDAPNKPGYEFSNND